MKGKNLTLKQVRKRSLSNVLSRSVRSIVIAFVVLLYSNLFTIIQTSFVHSLGQFRLFSDWVDGNASQIKNTFVLIIVLLYYFFTKICSMTLLILLLSWFCFAFASCRFTFPACCSTHAQMYKFTLTLTAVRSVVHLIHLQIGFLLYDTWKLTHTDTIRSHDARRWEDEHSV